MVRTVRAEAFLQCVDRTCADISEYHSQGADDEGGGGEPVQAVAFFRDSHAGADLIMETAIPPVKHPAKVVKKE